jgi:hypothetical protein
MTDGGAGVQPDEGGASVPVRPRSDFVAHEVFGHGPDAVLVEPEVARDLRNAAEYASQERRITGGLLYGRRWTDDEGPYLVVDGYLEAGPGENRDDRIDHDGRDSFALSDQDLRLLRDDAERMYSAARFEVGWWRSRPGPGEFSPRDLESQRQLVPPGGVGLLVFGSGLEWGTAYLGPDGEVPGSARSFIPVPRPAPESPQLPPPSPGPALAPPGPAPAPELEAEPEEETLQGGAPLQPATDLVPEPVGAAASGASRGTRRSPLTPPPMMSGPPVVSPVRVTAKEWASNKAASASYVGPETPTDVKIVVGALIAAAVVAAILVGVLLSNILVAVIAAVVLLLGLSGFLWMSRL